MATTLGIPSFATIESCRVCAVFVGTARKADRGEVSAASVVTEQRGQQTEAGASFLSLKERRFLEYLIRHRIKSFAPSELAAPMHVTGRSIVNWCAALVRNGFLVPDMSGKRIRSYQVTRPWGQTP